MPRSQAVENSVHFNFNLCITQNGQSLALENTTKTVVRPYDLQLSAKIFKYTVMHKSAHTHTPTHAWTV